MGIQTIQEASSIDARAPLRRLTAALASVALLLVVLSIFWADPAYADDDDSEEFVNGEIVVKLDPAPTVTIEQINAEYGTETKDTFLGSAKIYLLRVTDGEDTEAKAERLENDPQRRVLYAEPNFITDAPEGNPRYSARAGSQPSPSSDPAPYLGQYAVDALNLSCANGIGKGAGTTVAVLDTGAQLDHPALTNSFTPGYDFIGDDTNPADEPNGLDDDGDTYVDEMTGHGTHVAGIVHLTAPEADIMPLRVLDSDGRGNVFVIAEAIQYAVNNGADVINMSLGSSQESDLIEDITEDLVPEDDDDGDEADDGDAIEGVPPEGVVVAASAGNENTDVEQYPAAEDGVLSVTAVDEQERKSEWANHGSWVQIAAPGDDVYSTFPTDRYASWDGTSMAAPFVAGQAALIRGLEQSMDSAAVGDLIRTTARSLDAANPSYSGKLGAGHADAGASLQRLRPDARCTNNTAPEISNILPAPDSSTKDQTPTIRATVRDAQTDLAKRDMRLYLDGRRIDNFNYDASRDRLTYESQSLSRGSHTLKIVASDAQDATANRKWSFKVVR